MTIGKMLSGVGVGIVIGLLIAPEKGSQTRKKLSRVYNDVSDAVQGIVDKTSGLVNRLQQTDNDGSIEVRNVSTTIAGAQSESWQPKDL